MVDYYTLEVDEALSGLKSSLKGLDSADARKRLGQFGFNELKSQRQFVIFNILLDQFKNLLLLLLIFAGFLSIFLGDFVETGAIFFIIVLNVVLGFVQEYKAEKIVEALKTLSAPMAWVLRDNIVVEIPAREIVPGDIILLEAGTIVPADARIIAVTCLQIDESALTGESVPSKKIPESFKPGTSIADQENMAFSGTVVTYGKGRAAAIATGMSTEFGKIAASLQKREASKTPLQVKFSELAKQLGVVALALIAFVFIVGVSYGALTFGKMVLFTLALTVSTIPNSLPLIVTISLSLGARKLALQNMLVKKLPAAESLGSATIICSDKTGTITKNEMTITDIFYDNKLIRVTGTGYEPLGGFYLGDRRFNPKQLEPLLRVGYLCNNAGLVRKKNRVGIMGDPTEGSLLVLGKKGKLDEKKLAKQFKLVAELPFDPERKMMSVILQDAVAGKMVTFTKGAPDMLIKNCTRVLVNGRVRRLTQRDKTRILSVNNSFAQRALRVLALAHRELPDTKEYKVSNVEKGLVFIGLVGMIDPPREGVRKAVEHCHKAGIEVMLITGDHALTAKAIAQQIGLLKHDDLILTGEDIDRMSESELLSKIQKVRIVARALPIQKLRIVNALQKLGHVVAVTGDGVNDAPALKKADIGIAMGITGTDIAKEVAKAVLVDDNFATIVSAISLGRNIYDKMLKSAKYLLSCNSGEIVSVICAILLKLPLPLLPLQILLINLLTDDFPALGLSSEAVEAGVMDRPPRNPRTSPLSGHVLSSILVFGLVMGIGTILMFSAYQNINIQKAQTVAFTTLVMFQMFAVMSSRSLHFSLEKLNPLTNKLLSGAVVLSIGIQFAVIYLPPLQLVFGTTALNAFDWLGILVVSSLGFVVMELSKLVVKPKNAHF